MLRQINLLVQSAPRAKPQLRPHFPPYRHIQSKTWTHPTRSPRIMQRDTWNASWHTSVRLYHTSVPMSYDLEHEREVKQLKKPLNRMERKTFRRIFRVIWKSFFLSAPRMFLRKLYRKRKKRALQVYQREVTKSYYYEQLEEDKNPDQVRWAQEEFYLLKKNMALETKAREKATEEIYEWYLEEIQKAVYRHNKMYMEMHPELLQEKLENIEILDVSEMVGQDVVDQWKKEREESRSKLEDSDKESSEEKDDKKDALDGTPEEKDDNMNAVNGTPEEKDDKKSPLDGTPEEKDDKKSPLDGTPEEKDDKKSPLDGTPEEDDSEPKSSDENHDTNNLDETSDTRGADGVPDADHNKPNAFLNVSDLFINEKDIPPEGKNFVCEEFYISYEDAMRISNEYQIRLLELQTKRFKEETIDDELFRGRQQQRIVVQDEKRRKMEEEKAKKELEEEEEKVEEESEEDIKKAKKKMDEEERRRLKEERLKKLSDQYSSQTSSEKHKLTNLELMDTEFEAEPSFEQEMEEEEGFKLTSEMKGEIQALMKYQNVRYPGNVTQMKVSQFLYNIHPWDRKFIYVLSNQFWDEYIAKMERSDIGIRPLLIYDEGPNMIRPSVWKHDGIVYALSKRGYLAGYEQDGNDLTIVSSDFVDYKVRESFYEISAVPYLDEDLAVFKRTDVAHKVFLISKSKITDRREGHCDMRLIEPPPLRFYTPFTVKDALMVFGVNSVSQNFNDMMFYDPEANDWKPVHLSRPVPFYYPDWKKPGFKLSQNYWSDGTATIIKNDDESKLYILTPYQSNNLLYEIDTDSWTASIHSIPVPPLLSPTCAVDNDRILIVGGHTSVVSSHMMLYFDLYTKETYIPVQHGNAYPMGGDSTIIKLNDGYFGMFGGAMLAFWFNNKTPIPLSNVWVVQTGPDPEGVAPTFYVEEEEFGEEEEWEEEEEVENANVKDKK